MSVDAHVGEVVPQAVVATPLEDQEAPDNTVYLIVGERSFPCRRTGVSWHMMQFGHAQRKAQRIRSPHADVPDSTDPNKKVPCVCDQCKKAQAERTEAGMDMMDAMRALILKILKPEHKQDFIDYMDEADVEPNELESAIGDTIGRLGNQDSNAGKA